MISKFDIERLQALPIEQVATALGIAVSRHKSLCPFHSDSHPSLTFSVRKNRYRCFVCGASGGPIDIVMNYLHKDFLSACRWLSEKHDVVITVPEPSSLNPKPEKPFDASRYVRFFERPFLSDEAKRFLFAERKLDPRVIRWCRLTSWRDKQGIPWLQTPFYSRDGRLIGIQNRNLAYDKGSSFQFSNRRQTECNDARINCRGAKEEDEVKSQKNHIQNQSNDSVERFSSQFSNDFERSDHHLEPGTLNLEPTAPRFKFPRGAQCSIYNYPVLNLLKPGETLYIAEGCSDCWSLLSAGHKAIAIPSATLLSRKDKELLQSLNPQPSSLNLHFAMYPDQDLPGERLFLQLQKVLPSLVRHQLPPGCKDFSDYYLQGLGASG